MRSALLTMCFILAAFTPAGCKNNKEASGPVPSHGAGAEPAGAPAGDPDEPKGAKDPAPAATTATGEPARQVTNEPVPKPTGEFAAKTTIKPETEDKPGEIPTVMDFEEEAIAKITALNFDDELRAMEREIRTQLEGEKPNTDDGPDGKEDN